MDPKILSRIISASWREVGDEIVECHRRPGRAKQKRFQAVFEEKLVRQDGQGAVKDAATTPLKS